MTISIQCLRKICVVMGLAVISAQTRADEPAPSTNFHAIHTTNSTEQIGHNARKHNNGHEI